MKTDRTTKINSVTSLMFYPNQTACQVCPISNYKRKWYKVVLLFDQIKGFFLASETGVAVTLFFTVCVIKNFGLLTDPFLYNNLSSAGDVTLNWGWLV